MGLGPTKIPYFVSDLDHQVDTKNNPDLLFYLSLHASAEVCVLRECLLFFDMAFYPTNILFKLACMYIKEV